MGFNSTIVIMNDCLHEIAADKDFGKKVSDAIMALRRGEQVDIKSGCCCTAATAIETHHADQTSVIFVGGNAATVAYHTYGWEHDTPEFRKRVIRGLSESLKTTPSQPERKR